MFCPNCQAEYRPGFYKCADCNVDLVEELPAEEELEDEVEYDPDVTFVEVLRTNSFTDTAVIKSMLDGTGIRYYINGETAASMHYIQPMVLMVIDEDADQAAELLKPLNLKSLRFSL